MISSNQEIEKIMHGILPISKPQQIDNSQAQVKNSQENFHQQETHMDKEDFSDQVLQSHN